MGYEFFPPELLALAGSCGIGIALSVYPEPPSDQKASDRNAEPGAPPNGGPRRRLPIRTRRRGRHR